MRVMDDFNKNMLGFQFKLRIGFNHGPLTAGVIGTTKLLYDIWGDTVNIASRMDSTGVECRVQVSEESHRALSEMGYRFDYRGTVNVKGKGQMRTFLYPKSADSGPAPCLRLAAAPAEETNEKVRAGSSPGTVPSPTPTPAPVPGDRGATPNTAEDPEPVSVPSLPNNLTPLSNLALPHNPAPSSSAKQTTSTASVSPLLADLAQPEPPGSAPREEEAEEEGEEEANELTRLRGAERL